MQADSQEYKVYSGCCYFNLALSNEFDQVVMMLLQMSWYDLVCLEIIVSPVQITGFTILSVNSGIVMSSHLGGVCLQTALFVFLRIYLKLFISYFRASLPESS